MLTTLVTQDGSWHWVRMPFGLKGAPGFFLKLVWEMVTDEEGFKWMVVYLDDVIIFAQTAKECWAGDARAMK